MLLIFPKIFLSIGLLLSQSFFLRENSSVQTIHVAMIDTGVDWHHEILHTYVDQESSWNFINNSNDLSDSDGHGTHVAGIIVQAARKLNPHRRLRLSAIKYDKKSFLKALRYAVALNPDIINISGGGPNPRDEELKLLEMAWQKGILVVAAAGNKPSRQMNFNFYPAAYELPNIYSVIGVNTEGQVLTTSNRNQSRNNILALGNHIYSALPGNKYGYRTGSSQAAALVTGELAATIVIRDVSIPSNKQHISKR